MRQGIVAIILLCLVLAPTASATTLLTNGVPVRFVLPGTSPPHLFKGDIGFAIYVPPDANSLTVELIPDNANYEVEVWVRRNFDVGFDGQGNAVRDYQSKSVGNGVQQVIATLQSYPPLQGGTYYIGFNVLSANSQLRMTLTATVDGGSVEPIRVAAISTFDKDVDGWTLNSPPTALPGASQGNPSSTLKWVPTGGNRDGYVRYDEYRQPSNDALVAPAKFLGDLTALEDPRFVFDFRVISRPGAAAPVEIRIFGSGTGFVWHGGTPAPPPGPNLPPKDLQSPLPPPPPIPGSCGVSPLGLPPDECGWQRFIAPLQQPYWGWLIGPASFDQVLANVERIEVVMDLVPFLEANGIDNFALVGRGVGPPQKVMTGNTSFVSGIDGWSRNYPASKVTGATTGNANSAVRWVPFEGNPEGYLRMTDAGGSNRDYAVAPEQFLGDYTGIINPQFEFDYLHDPSTTATKPLEIRLMGAESVFVWTGPTPGPTWTHYMAPLSAAFWQRASGSGAFALALANVQRIEISVDQVDGPEANCLDNFWLLTAGTMPAPPAMSANPATLSFTAVKGGANPASQSLSVTSMGGGPALGFTAAATSDGNWLRILQENGTTPQIVNVGVDASSLAEGTYSGQVAVTTAATGVSPQTVPVSLTVIERPGGTPRINSGGVINAASYRTQLAAGGLGSIYGSGFGPAQGVEASFIPGTSNLPTLLGGVRVLVEETYGALIAEAPLLYVDENQINFQLPFEAFGRSEVLLVVDNDGVQSEPAHVQVTSSAPGIFTYGEDRAVATNEDSSVNAAGNAARRGSALTVYMTGQGVVTPQVPTGSAAPMDTLVRAPLPARVWLGGAPARILFLGLAPGLVGVLQLNVEVPEGAPSGDSPLVVNIAGWTSNTPLVSVR